jgi:hypothetical protein
MKHATHSNAENSAETFEIEKFSVPTTATCKAVLPLRQRDSDSIKKKSLYSCLLVEPSVRNGASSTSATTMR